MVERVLDVSVKSCAAVVDFQDFCLILHVGLARRGIPLDPPSPPDPPTIVQRVIRANNDITARCLLLKVLLSPPQQSAGNSFLSPFICSQNAHNVREFKI